MDFVIDEWHKRHCLNHRLIRLNDLADFEKYQTVETKYQLQIN